MPTKTCAKGREELKAGRRDELTAYDESTATTNNPQTLDEGFEANPKADKRYMGLSDKRINRKATRDEGNRDKAFEN